ncbi:MAG: mannose-1-phosphate guanylyltransferase [Bosea sp. (in: a-proteobacteria)]
MARAALILSGGGGLRLWPASTEHKPKQFLSLFDHDSLFERTLKRLKAAKIDVVYVIGNARHRNLLEDQAKAVGLSEIRFLFEPARRDSAAAIAAGVAAISNDLGDDTVVLALPCDHLIPDEAAFAASVDEAVELAGHGFLCTFGLLPSFASVEFGYIQRGRPVEGHSNAFMVERFHEKPRQDVAERYAATEGFYWNSGMFAFEARTFAREAAMHMPDVWHAAAASVKAVREEGRCRWLDQASFERSPKISIDFGLMEKSNNVGVVPASFPWSDVGTWAAVHEASKSASDDVVLQGDVVVHDVSNAMVHADGLKVIVAGVSDIVVVATRDGVFVCRKDMTPIVKQLLEWRS